MEGEDGTAAVPPKAAAHVVHGELVWLRHLLKVIQSGVIHSKRQKQDQEKRQSFGDCFWKRINDEGLAEGIEWLINHGFAIERLQTFQGQFWSGIASQTSTAVPDMMQLLMNEYGVHVDDLSKLRGFWAEVKRQGRFEAIRDELATKRLPSHVTRYVRSLNGDTPFGSGATKCKFARPKVVVKHAPRPTATKQASIASFFGAPSREM